MTDRSDEETVTDSQSTEDLLSETERLLSETGGDGASDEAAPANDAATELPTDEFPTDADGLDEATAPSDAEPAEESDSSRTWLGRVTPSVGLPARLSPTAYFSPKAFVGLSGLFAIGYLGGGFTIPVAGSIVGLFATAFGVGVLASRRRYLEVTAAGGAVGAIMAAFNYAVAIAGGFGGRLVVAGITAGLVACLLGYYLGRDLRDGVTRTE